MNHALDQKHYTVRELAQVLNCSIDTIYRACDDGLFYRQVGRERRIPESAAVEHFRGRVSVGVGRVVALGSRERQEAV